VIGIVLHSKPGLLAHPVYQQKEIFKLNSSKLSTGHIDHFKLQMPLNVENVTDISARK